MKERPGTTGRLEVMGKQGDLKYMWDKNNKAEVDIAKQQFEDLQKKGYRAFKVNKDGTKGELIRKFDPDLERIIMSPPLVGG